MKIDLFSAWNWFWFFVIFSAGASATVYSLYQYYQSVVSDDELSNQKVKTEYYQNETLKYALGDGYAVVLLGENPNQNTFNVFLENTSKYPIYDSELSGINYTQLKNCGINESANEVIVNRACFLANNAIIFENHNLKPGKISPLNYAFRKETRSLFYVFQLSARHITTIQYCINLYDVATSRYTYSYKLFKIEPNNSYTLLKEGGPQLNPEIWKQNLPYCKEIRIEGL
ncbi:hypothetical protein IRZ71_05605 [Flavobacterium sp. ANB]|uniref:hypothetical protein n=1 Tax=unclassified Flavobacterium TaxID=196869 RepID=UPI0012B9BD38|nr:MULTISPECIES: hypothetical protein [unclassified Flavobacterium]MBF4515806.1 hypothetical protein [Flavobacterium sp. ANB]MTD68809.1 hypothetical protein [Flavobacterium sp. LC2016-13]